MKANLFASERIFKMYDVNNYFQLLLRSARHKGYNFDIIFYGVKYVQLPIHLNGIIINDLENEMNIISYKLDSRYKDEWYYLYEIISEDNKFYVVSSGFKVFENEMGFGESSIDYSHKGYEKLIADSFNKNS
jgi:hypothetical protein